MASTGQQDCFHGAIREPQGLAAFPLFLDNLNTQSDMPPSIWKAVPVTKEASSETR
jgi:hypothetical protein